MALSKQSIVIKATVELGLRIFRCRYKIIKIVIRSTLVSLKKVLR